MDSGLSGNLNRYNGGPSQSLGDLLGLIPPSFESTRRFSQGTHNSRGDHSKKRAEALQDDRQTTNNPLPIAKEPTQPGDFGAKTSPGKLQR